MNSSLQKKVYNKPVNQEVEITPKSKSKKYVKLSLD